MEIVVKILFSIIVITGWFVTWWLLVELPERKKGIKINHYNNYYG